MTGQRASSTSWAATARARAPSPIPNSPSRSSMSPATPRCGSTTNRPTAAGRLENLKELVRSMEEFENLGGFLEHVSLVMDRDTGEAEDAVSIMTLHSAKGLEFDTVFLPGWEEGLFPSQRTLDESGRAGLEEERRLAYVGLTRARKRLRVFLAQNRRIHGLWQSAIPSRFRRRTAGRGGRGQGHRLGLWRLRLWRAQCQPLRHAAIRSIRVYETPGWQRARAQSGQRKSAGPLTIDGDLVARSVDDGRGSAYDRRRTRLPPQIRLRPRRRHRRQQADASSSKRPGGRRCWIALFRRGDPYPSGVLTSLALVLSSPSRCSRKMMKMPAPTTMRPPTSIGTVGMSWNSRYPTMIERMSEAVLERRHHAHVGVAVGLGRAGSARCRR